MAKTLEGMVEKALARALAERGQGFNRWWVQNEIDLERGTENSEIQAAQAAWDACEKRYQGIADLVRHAQTEHQKVAELLETIAQSAGEA